MNQARLKEVPFFSSMAEQELAAVAQHTDEISVAPGGFSHARVTSARSSS
jgi:hypothetical protein